MFLLIIVFYSNLISNINLPIFINFYLFTTYINGVKYNIFNLSTKDRFLYKPIILFIVLIFILNLQKYLGSKFFIPKSMRSDYYQYFIKFDKIKKKLDNLECIICYNNLRDQNGKINLKISFNPKILITPCNHLFHIKCLKTWMDHKLICPYCKTKIPPINN